MGIHNKRERPDRPLHAELWQTACSLIDAGANVNHVGPGLKLLALFTAIVLDRADVVYELLRRGASTEVAQTDHTASWPASAKVYAMGLAAEGALAGFAHFQAEQDGAALDAAVPTPDHPAHRQRM